MPRPRPLDRLPSIRAKLGLVIVFAVGMTVLLVYLLLGYALRNSWDADMMRMHSVAVRMADRVAETGDPVSIGPLVPDDLSAMFLPAGGGSIVTVGDARGVPPRFRDGHSHWGTSGGLDYVAVPVVAGERLLGTVYAFRPSDTLGIWDRVVATLGFLRGIWWQLIVGGALAAGVALFLARLLALGMTRPLREMARAAGRMAEGDYSVRVEPASHDEVGQLAVAFNRMSGELANLERLRRDLVANVSHELKTPLFALRARLENILDGVERPDAPALQVMLQQCDRLTRLVEQLLDLSRLESGDVPLACEALDLGPLVDRVLSEVQPASSGRGIRLEGIVPADAPPVWADRERVHQVLFNLLDNAVRFTPGGGRVTVTVRPNHADGRCDVSVGDSGPGISPEHLPRLFERFYRVDPARSRGDGGTGIGLAIARSVVEAHGGHIRAESEVGTGSLFTFDLPLAPGGDRRVAAPVGATGGTGDGRDR